MTWRYQSLLVGIPATLTPSVLGVAIGESFMMRDWWRWVFLGLALGWAAFILVLRRRVRRQERADVVASALERMQP